ncbi:hypothetical protein [Roseomonas xinghualingensis]|uniref:hypothetical protein n=1 Tax=Roseomonas xinghualingensis TaxID=2986475 RepID=UPI0021F223B1|nr:hypothetical protein [Roseomonas sp. SXEYE001]MCV4209829.1 hypothetical protein [Roseomonas sp. SXEYE001]
MILQRLSQSVSVLLLVVGWALICITINYVMEKFIPTQFWDQWDFVSVIASEPDVGGILKDLVKPHNEHIILTSKLLFYADYLLFDLTNALTIFVVNLAIVGTSALLAFIAFPERLGIPGRTLLVTGSIAAGWTLSQWENLIWGFQPQFILVLLFGLLTLRASVAWLDAAPRSGWVLPLTQLLLVSLTALSLSSGVLIFLAIGFVVLARRAPLRRAAALVGPSLLFFALYLWWTSPRQSIGDPELRTTGNFLHFLLTMLGSPFTDSWVGPLVGGLLLLTALLWFAYSVVLPWWNHRLIDAPTLLLSAFGIFITAGLLGIAWGRTPLGPDAALASRYCTPTMMLWLSLLLSMARHVWLSLRGAAFAPMTLPAIVFSLLLLGWGAGTQPHHLTNLETRHRQVVQSTYFVLAGVWSNEMIRPTYPEPDKVRPLLAYLKKHGLGIFSSRSTLPMPSWSLIFAMNRLDGIDWCSRYSIDAVFRLGENGWKVNGWAQEPETLEFPAWLLAFDEHGRLRGFTPAMTRRPDLTHSLGASANMRGFSLPVGPAAADGEASRNISIIVGFRNHAGVCRMEYKVRLPGPGGSPPPPSELGPV